MDFNYFYNKYLPANCPFGDYTKIKQVDLIVDEKEIVRWICWHANEPKMMWFEYGYSAQVKDLDEITNPNQIILRTYYHIPAHD